jgi:hypothetical protein
MKKYPFLKLDTLSLGLILVTVFLFPSLLFAKREHPEKWYQEKWCQAHNGQIEVVLPDGTTLLFADKEDTGNCSDIGNYERQKILESAEYNYRTL